MTNYRLELEGLDEGRLRFVIVSLHSAGKKRIEGVGGPFLESDLLGETKHAQSWFRTFISAKRETATHSKVVNHFNNHSEWVQV